MLVMRLELESYKAVRSWNTSFLETQALTHCLRQMRQEKKPLPAEAVPSYSYRKGCFLVRPMLPRSTLAQ